MPGLILEPHELVEITNGLTQPCAQLRVLHRLGFHLAARPRNGPVVLTRAHFEAVQSARPQQQLELAQNARTGPNVVGLAQWATKRGSGGQKAQRR